MCFFGNGSIGHRTGLKALHDFIHTFYFFDWNTFFWINKIHQTSDVSGFLFIYHLGVLLKLAVIPLSGCHLKHMNGCRIIAVCFALGTHFVSSC